MVIISDIVSNTGIVNDIVSDILCCSVSDIVGDNCLLLIIISDSVGDNC